MALKSLATNKDVIVTKPDKGRWVVVLDRNTYVNKINEFISDRTKFELISAPVDRYTRKIELVYSWWCCKLLTAKRPVCK